MPWKPSLVPNTVYNNPTTWSTWAFFFIQSNSFVCGEETHSQIRLEQQNISWASFVIWHFKRLKVIYSMINPSRTINVWQNWKRCIRENCSDKLEAIFGSPHLNFFGGMLRCPSVSPPSPIAAFCVLKNDVDILTNSPKEVQLSTAEVIFGRQRKKIQPWVTNEVLICATRDGSLHNRSTRALKQD